MLKERPVDPNFHLKRSAVAAGETIIFGLAGIIYPPSYSVAAVTAGAILFELVLHVRNSTVEESPSNKS